MRCSVCGYENMVGAKYCSNCSAEIHNEAKLGPYELVEELGRGAMARVWRAWDPRLEREVAIKVPMFDERLPPDVLEEMGRRFVREGVTAARLNHPNIVTIHEADVYDDVPAIVMELVDGVTLSKLLENGPLKPDAAYDALSQLLDAVDYAHEKGVVHRDIKPDNIFVNKNGRVKLADFGIAHIEGSGKTHATVAGAVLGTPGYMSPEQIKGNPIDNRSDLFSIGVVAYEMFTGHNPFGVGEGADMTTLAYRVVNEPVPEITASLVDGLPTGVRSAISAALAKEPENRPRNAREFRAMLLGSEQPHSSPLKSEVKDGGTAKPKWLPYLIVGGVCIVALLVVFIGANSSAGGGSARGAMSGGANALIPVGQETIAGETEGETEAEETKKKEEANKKAEEAKEKEEEGPMLNGAYPPRFTSADASSQLPDEYYEGDGYFTYGPELVLDDNIQTAWNEGVSGPGIGQWIRVSASTPQLVYGVSIRNGYPRKDQTYHNNHRIKDCTIELSDGYKLSCTLQDAYNQWQDIEFDQGHDTLWIKITIDSVYYGEKHDDTCLSGIRAY